LASEHVGIGPHASSLTRMKPLRLVSRPFGHESAAVVSLIAVGGSTARRSELGSEFSLGHFAQCVATMRKVQSTVAARSRHHLAALSDANHYRFEYRYIVGN